MQQLSEKLCRGEGQLEDNDSLAPHLATIFRSP